VPHPAVIVTWLAAREIVPVSARCKEVNPVLCHARAEITSLHVWRDRPTRGASRGHRGLSSDARATDSSGGAPFFFVRCGSRSCSGQRSYIRQAPNTSSTADEGPSPFFTAYSSWAPVVVRSSRGTPLHLDTV